MRLLLRGLRWHSEGRTHRGDLRIRGGRIAGTGRGLRPARRERVVDASGHVALPGLINAHDHLQLDLFPRLGSPPYGDFYQWAEEIHHPRRSPLREILRVPLRDRLRWGGYRNLLGGATTVMHHDPYHRRVFGRSFPVRVIRRFGWAHSLGYEPDVPGAFARSRGRPFVIHAMEGVNGRAEAELERLEAMGVLAPNTVLVHAVAATAEALRRIERAGASVVWCPASNRFLFGRTFPAGEARGRIPLALGTDSTLSGSPTLLDEAREAARGGTPPEAILALATTGAARVLGVDDGRGTLRPGTPADLVLLPDGPGAPAERLLEARPRDLVLVLVGGRARLASPPFAGALALGVPKARVEGEPRWFHGDLEGLRHRIREAVGDEILALNPVWRLLEPPASPPESPRPPHAPAGLEAARS